MLPPKNRLSTASSRTSAPGQEGAEHPGAVGAGDHGHRAARPGPLGPDGRRRPRVAPGSRRRGARRPRRRSRGAPPAPPTRSPPKAALEGPDHADAVLVLGEPLVAVGRRHRPLGQQVVLVGGEDQAPSEHREEHLLPAGRRCRRPRPPRRGVGPHVGLVGVAAEPERHHADRGQLGYSSRMPAMVSSSTAPSFTPGQTTTWPWTSMPPASRHSSQRRLVAPSGCAAWRPAPRGRWRGWRRTGGPAAR